MGRQVGQPQIRRVAHAQQRVGADDDAIGGRQPECNDDALAKVALEDDFADQLLALKGTIPRDVDLGA